MLGSSLGNFLKAIHHLMDQRMKTVKKILKQYLENSSQRIKTTIYTLELNTKDGFTKVKKNKRLLVISELFSIALDILNNTKRSSSLQKAKEENIECYTYQNRGDKLPLFSYAVILYL